MDKKKIEELMKARVAPMVDRQVVMGVDLLKPAAPEVKAINNQTTEAANMFTDKAVNIQETKNESLETDKKRGRPKSAVEGLVHFSTWLPEELAWAIRAKAVALHKKDYEVVTEAIEEYLGNH
ncbi:MAG TPA: hypothetical protein VFB98_03875 [Candidatus Deferrimicrobium sp.]|nr:hypothetical protein [Candidatus Deferrimicrobium sp.]